VLIMNRRIIRCAWCHEEVKPKAPRIKIADAEGGSGPGILIATLHPECGEVIMETLDERKREAFAA
jgi:hypothetical protein